MNFLEIGLAGIEGLALIVCACILPVLPLVLSASAEGGRGGPYGIITGFVVAFSLFVLGSRQIVTALHIDLDLIKDASLVLLFLFGVVLLSEKLSANFSSWTQGAADLGSRLAGAGEGGFFSGLSIGALIGLVWIPCAGPILAAVLVQAIRQQTNLESVLVTVAFAGGEEKITAQEQGALLKMNFKAKKVFLVMGTASGKPSAATVQLNGEPPGTQSSSDVHNGAVTVNGHALYELINQASAQNSELEIVAKDPELEFYAFTFGE